MAKNITESFGQRLVRLRTEQQLTVQELANATGIQRSRLSAFELEAKSPGLDNLIRLADYFQVSVDYMLGRSELRVQNEPFAELTDLYEQVPAGKRTALLNSMRSIVEALK
jgi:transcriptional regulator with XRE-family HTH domain